MTHRHLFEIPSRGPYLLSHSAGCLPKSVRVRMEGNYFTPWAETGGEGWGAWLKGVSDFKTALSHLFGGNVADFCPKPNVSAGLYSLLSALPVHPKRNVVLASEQMFPSLGFVVQNARSLGLSLRLIPADLDPTDVSVWESYVTDDVTCAIIMHVHSNSGLFSPVRPLCDLLRKRGIFTIVDIAQSVGIIPIALEDFLADAVIGSCLKWLCGGNGAGFMWVSPDIAADLRPQDTGWFSHQNPFEMDITHFEYADGANRFWGGTPSVAPFVIAAAGIETLCDIGIDRVFTHNRALIAELKAMSGGVLDDYDETRRGGTLCLDLKARKDPTTQALKSANVFFDQRGDILRLSFHIFNTQADVEIVARCLKI